MENRSENRSTNCKKQNRTTNQTNSRTTSSSQNSATNEHKHPNQYTKGAGAVNHAGSDNLLHAFAQHVLPPQAGDLLIGAVDQDRVGLSVRNVKSVIDAVQDRKELSVELPLASPQQRGVFSNENTLGLLHPSPPLLAFRQLLGTSPSSITMGMPHFPVINVSKRSSSAASRNAETGMIYAPCPK